MSPPPGFQLANGSQHVCKLKKALYGLKQSPRAWFERFSQAVKCLGYLQSQADHTLFVKCVDGATTILIVYVDDIIVTGDNTAEILKMKELLAKEFEIKDLGRLRYFLGIEVARSGDYIFISQRKYALDLLRDTGMLGARPANTPVEQNHKLDSQSGDLLTDASVFQRLVGRLIYLTLTRPDIAYAVSVISQYMHAPRTSHLIAAHRILRYLKSSPGRGLLFQKHDNLRVEAFTDDDWAGAQEDRRSTSGYCTFVGGNLVTWRSKKQPVVARSSAEAALEGTNT
ncbi:Beta-galactosidase 8 [Ranunculus cassubicifolius]